MANPNVLRIDPMTRLCDSHEDQSGAKRTELDQVCLGVAEMHKHGDLQGEIDKRQHRSLPEATEFFVNRISRVFMQKHRAIELVGIEIA